MFPWVLNPFYNALNNCIDLKGIHGVFEYLNVISYIGLILIFFVAYSVLAITKDGWKKSFLDNILEISLVILSIGCFSCIILILELIGYNLWLPYIVALVLGIIFGILIVTSLKGKTDDKTDQYQNASENPKQE